MAQNTSLTQAAANAKITQVDDAMASAHTVVKKLQDNTQQMTTTSWQGNQSQVFGQKMAQVTDDMTQIVNRMQQIADQGKQNINALVAQDSE
jgi:uncharacterized protein YukE